MGSRVLHGIKLADFVPGPTGIMTLNVYRRGLLIERSVLKNLVVTASKAPLANLLGGNVANNSVTTIGYGTGTAAPVIGNTGLTSPFTKAVDAVTYPAAGQVSFAFSLATVEDNGVALSQFGLFSRAGALVSLLVSASPLNKLSDISLAGTWVITF